MAGRFPVFLEFPSPAMPRPAYPQFPTRPEPAAINRLFALQHETDPLGTRLHLVTAALALFLAGFPTSVVEWAALPLLICFVVRLWTHHRVIGPLFWDPLARVSVAWAGWVGLSVFWTFGGRHHWIDDGQSLRFALLIPAIYPVIDHRRVLILALVLGLMCGQVSQYTHLISQLAGHSLFDRDPQRVSGWWDPVMAGSLLCAALGLQLGLLIETWTAPSPGRGGAGRSRGRWSAAIISTLGCIVLTGTRGAWIAAAGLIVLATLMLGRQIIRTRGRTAALTAAGVAAAVLALGVMAVIATPPARSRLIRATQEIQAAIGQQDYRSDTGLRIAMARWAMIESATHPLIGVGAGGYRPFAAARCTEASPKTGDDAPTRKPRIDRPSSPKDPATGLPLPHAHAHSWFLHTLATLGAIGLAVLLGLLSVAIGCARSTPLVLGLVGLIFAGLFDTIHVNQQTAFVLYAMLALCMRYRPSTPLAAATPSGATP